MTVTADQVAYAEEAYSRLEEAISYMRSAAEQLRQPLPDLADALVDLIASAKEEKDQYDEVLAEADRLEQQQMNRDFERSVL